MEVIFISGPSGAGKSTIAAELQARLVDSWLVYEVDRCQPRPPPRVEFATVENDRAMVRASVAAVRSYVDAGFSLLAELDVADPFGLSVVSEVLGGRARTLVLTCSPEVAVHRALLRGNGVDLDFVRRHAASRNWNDTGADRVEPTDGRTPAEIVASLLTWIESTPNSSA